MLLHQAAAFRKILSFSFAFVLQSTEVGTHFIGQTGKAIQQFGIVQKHFIFPGILVHNIVVHFTPAFLEQRSSLNFNIVAFVLDDVMQGTVNTVGNDFNLRTIINLAITCPLIRFRTFGNIIVVRIFIKVVETVPDV